MAKIGDAVLAASVNDPSVVINRTLGLGTENKITQDTLEHIVHFYEDLNIKRYFLHIYPDELPENGKDMLDTLGLQKSRGWMKFARDNSPPPDAPTELEIKEAQNPEEALHFGRIVASAFGMTENSAPMLAALASDPG